MSALLSTTMRFNGVIGQETPELSFRQSARRGTPGHLIAKPLELLHVQRAQPVKFLGGEKHGYVALLAADDHRFALCRVQQGGEALLGGGGRDVTHENILTRFGRISQLGQNGQSRLRRLNKRVDDAQALEAAEIAVAGDELRDAVLETQGCDVSVVDQVTRRARLANDLIKKGNVAFRFSQKNQRGRGEDAPQIVERDVEWNRRMEHPRMGDHAKKFVNAGPGKRPRKRAFREALDQPQGGLVVTVRRNFGVNQDVGINGLHDLEVPPFDVARPSWP